MPSFFTPISKSFIFLFVWSLFLFTASFAAEAADSFDYQSEIHDIALYVPRLNPMTEILPLLQEGQDEVQKTLAFALDVLPFQLRKVAQNSPQKLSIPHSPDQIRRQVSAVKSK